MTYDEWKLSYPPHWDNPPEEEPDMLDFVQAGHAAYIRGVPSGANPGKTLAEIVSWSKGWDRGEEEAWERLGDTALIPASALIRMVTA